MSSSLENVIRLDTFSPCSCATRSKWGDLDIIPHLDRCIDQWEQGAETKINGLRRSYGIKSALEGIGLKCFVLVMRRESTMRSCSGQEASFNEYLHSVCLLEHYENHENHAMRCAHWKEAAQRMRAEACAQINAQGAWGVVAESPWDRDVWSIVWEMTRDFDGVLPLKFHMMSQAERYLISQRTAHSSVAQGNSARL